MFVCFYWQQNMNALATAAAMACYFDQFDNSAQLGKDDVDDDPRKDAVVDGGVDDDSDVRQFA